ncbi:MAG: TSUP family transporter [Acidimicrobiales bacterium]
MNDLLAAAGSVAATTHAAGGPNPVLLAVAGLVGGVAVGVTGMGGGALMTPALVLLFGVDPRVAVASDLVNSLVMKPVGGAVHLKRGTIHWSLVRWLVVGSVPSAFLGAYLLNRLGDGKDVQAQVKQVLGWALLVAASAIVAKATLVARARSRRPPGEEPNLRPYTIKAAPTLLVGMVGGLIVGMTSVGSGSLMIVLLMLLYPRLSSKTLVGTDLVQAIPLVASATAGQLVFGHVDLGVAAALVVGSIPGVYLGARFSALAPDGVVRPVLVSILVASALALLMQQDYRGLGRALVILALTGIPLWAAVDATLRPTAHWERSGRRRTRWVAVLGIGAPFGIGFVASLVYLLKVRPQVCRAAAVPVGKPAPPGPVGGTVSDDEAIHSP